MILLVKCNDCGKKISRTARTCPNCGKHNAGKKSRSTTRSKKQREKIRGRINKKEKEDREKFRKSITLDSIFALVVTLVPPLYFIGAANNLEDTIFNSACITIGYIFSGISTINRLDKESPTPLSKPDLISNRESMLYGDNFTGWRVFAINVCIFYSLIIILYLATTVL